MTPLVARMNDLEDTVYHCTHETDVIDPECYICRLKKPFKMPEEIVEAVGDRNLVIFAGAGISTEARGVFKITLYEEIRNESGLDQHNAPTFPMLMSQYCSPPRTRGDLLRKIKARFDYMKTFPAVYRDATRFHRELATIPQIQEIVTTNWDDLFERECDATPIVTGADFGSFAALPGRKVFKIHGSINNIGSIVATEEDYERNFEELRTGLIGSKLKVVLATKKIVFLGYSFQDEDFKRILRLLQEEMNQLLPHSYVVTLEENAKEKLKSLGVNATPIFTDAAYFVSKLKDCLVKRHRMLPDERFYGIDEIFNRLMEAHQRLVSNINCETNPEIIFALSYQDGLAHAFEDILETKKSGRFSDIGYVHQMIHSYEFLRKRELRARDYYDVAYIDGFMNGLACLLADDRQRRRLPLYYVFGSGDILTYLQYRKLARNASKLHKTAFEYARRRVRKFRDKKLVVQHIPFL